MRAKPSGTTRIRGTALAAAAIVAMLAIGVERADAFGTYNHFGQNAEHERITRVLQCGNPAPVADCIQLRTMGQVAGRDGTLGAVGQPDDLRELYAFPYAHCDGADFLDRPSYPQSIIEANSHLQRCAFAGFQRLNAAVEAAGQIVDANGRLRVSETDISDCGFPSATTASTADSKTAKCQVVNQFGRTLHAIEDFWSHSNWADVAGPGNVGVTNPPGLLRTAIPDFFRYGTNGGVANAGQLQIPAGLITGCDDSSPTEHVTHSCGKSGTSGDRVKHSVLNKDKGTINPATGAVSGPDTPRGKIAANFAAAVTGARAHVGQTWADLTAAIRARYGGARGDAIVLAISSDTPWTRCVLSGASPNAQNQPVGNQNSTRSTTVTVQNRTSSAFGCAEAVLGAGEWASLPPDTVGAGDTARFRTQTDLKRGQKDTRGAALYSIGTSGYLARITWSNPLVGSNAYSCDFVLNGQVVGNAPFACSRSGGSGNDATPAFTITSRGRAPEPEVAAPPGSRGEAGSGEGDSDRPDPLVLGERAMEDCGGYARNFSLHVDGDGCGETLRRIARTLERDELCPGDWDPRRNVRIEDYNAEGDRGEELPPLVMCSEEREGGDGDRERFAFQVLAH